MILDIESPPKSPTSSGPTVRQASGPSVGRVPVSYSTFPQTRHSTQYNNEGSLETRPLLYQVSRESVYDDTEPPAYDEIHATPKASSSRNWFWTRGAAVLLGVFLVYLTFYSYDLGKIHRPIRTPSDTPAGPLPPATSTGSPPPPSPLPSPPSAPPNPSPPSSSPPLPPLPPVSPIPNLPTLPFIPPTKGRIDLCRPWAYSSKPGVRPSYSDSQPIDKLVYTVPTLAPIHMETAAICSTSKGTSELCEEYDDTYDSIAGKLQVVGAEVELPQIEVTIQHGSEDGLDSTAVCLMKRPDENGKDRWILGLYAWRDPTTDDRDALLISMSIVVTLPRSQIHNLSTRLNYFTQVIGPETKTDSNTLTFDTLQARLGERGSLLVRNVTVATIHTRAFADTQLIEDTRVTKSVRVRSDSGMIGCWVSLVQTEDSLPVQMDIQSEIGSVAARAILEYPHTSSSPQFDIEVFSRFSPAMLLVQDPQGTRLLRRNPELVPDSLPIIRVNTTSHLSIAQAALPATYHGALSLNSKHVAIVAIDHAKDVPGRTVSWGEPTRTGYQGTVQWAEREDRQKKAGSVFVTTEYASARLLFLGLDDDDISNWPEDGDTITFGRLP